MTRMWSKKVTQGFIKRLREAGYTVDKTNNGYKIDLDGTIVFRAMIGSRGYLVHMDNRLVCESQTELMQA